MKPLGAVRVVAIVDRHRKKKSVGEVLEGEAKGAKLAGKGGGCYSMCLITGTVNQSQDAASAGGDSSHWR